MKRLGLKKEFILFLLLIFFSLFLFFADHQKWLGSAKGLAHRPILATQVYLHSLYVSASNHLSPFFSGKKSQREIIRLQGMLQQLAFDQNKLSLCLEENKQMRQLLGAPLPSKWKFLPASVSGRAEGGIRIDKGTQAGIKKGMMVVSENILVGRVISVDEESSFVQLPTDKDLKILVLVKKPGNFGVQARGLLVHQSGKLIVDQIIQSEDIRVGDLVSTAGGDSLANDEPGWLPDLLLGQVKEVSGEGAAIYKKAEMSPLVDYQNLGIVFVVISS